MAVIQWSLRKFFITLAPPPSPPATFFLLLIKMRNPEKIVVVYVMCHICKPIFMFMYLFLDLLSIVVNAFIQRFIKVRMVKWQWRFSDFYSQLRNFKIVQKIP